MESNDEIEEYNELLELRAKCAAMEDVVKAAGSFEWDEEHEAHDTALYRWEKAIAEALQNYSRWQQSQESP